MSNRITPPTVRQTPGGPTGSEVRQLMRSVPQTPKRVVLYARVSTDEQAEKGYSISDQLRSLREHVTREGYDVVEEIVDDGYSGATPNRPGLFRIMELAEDGTIDVVLATKRDRFFRS